ncbi:MAG: nucleotidyltransferase domain-containing protein [candidate division WOR-3 bacterium]|nr:nucleotidyltransferase domain-containing protein [candidate division WOR-3 bacterium]
MNTDVRSAVTRTELSTASPKLALVGPREFERVLGRLLTELKGRFRDRLLGVVLFGSVARRQARAGSDLDVLVVIEESSLESDLEVVAACARTEASAAYEDFRSRHTAMPIVPIATDSARLKANPLILLDMLDEGVVLHDPAGVMDDLFGRLRAKLETLGAKKVRLEHGRWMWFLKPDWRPSEVVEVGL